MIEKSNLKDEKSTLITYFIYHHEFDEMGELSMGNYFDVNFRRKYVKQIRRRVACEIAQKFEE